MHINRAIVFSCALLLAGCRKDSSIGPDAGTISPPSETKIIGPDGGSIGTTGFLLTVPPGAFAVQETVKVSVDPGNQDFGAWMLSAAFKVEGLPAICVHPLRVKLTCQRSPSTGTFVAIGRQATSPSTGATDMIYDPIPAKDSSGFLLADISKVKLGNRLKRTSGISGTLDSFVWLLAMDQQDTMKSSGGHFKIFYPKYLEGRVTNLAGHLEDAYTKFDQMGFNNGTYEVTEWPVPVSVSRFSQPNSGLLGYFLLLSRDSQNHPFWGLRFNEDMIGSATNSMTRCVAANIFSYAFFTQRDHFFWVLHSAQEYDNEDNRVWPYYAIAAWSEDKFVTVPEQPLYTPMGFKGRESRPLQGMSVPGSETSETHGAAMSGLMKYIANTYSESMLPTLYYSVRNSTHAADALITSIPVGPDIWWPDFLKKYLSGSIYNVSSDSLLKQFNNISNTDQFSIALPSDTAKHFLASYTDLSAKLFKVNLRYPGINDNSWLLFSVGPGDLNFKYVGVMLFGLKDKKLEYWGFGKEVRVENIKSLTAAGYDIVAAVINSASAPPYLGSWGIELTVRINGGGGDIPLQGSFYAKIGGTFTNSYLTTLYRYMIYPSSNAKDGILSDRKFTASWHGTVSGPRTEYGNMVLTFDNSLPPHLIAFSLSDTATGAGQTYTWHLTSSNNCDIPGVLDYTLYTFTVTGTATRDVVGTLEYTYSKDDGYWEKFVSFTPSAGDLIYIVVQKW